MSRTRLYLIGGSVAVVLLLALAYAVLATIFGWWTITVDVVLCITALVSLLMLAALTYAVFSLTRTVLKIRAEILPVLESLKDTTSTVRETARVASVFGVDPAVRTASAVMGAGEIASVVFGRGHVRSRSEKRQRRRQELERDLARSELNGHNGVSTLNGANGHR
ncbi:MAG: hypothetical protein ABI068_14310 [Ktedonobacterales bacterium]